MVLPHDVWYHYYDRPCDICEEQIHWREKEHEDCEKCQKLMCYDCRQESVCHICEEKLERDEDVDLHEYCQSCMESCKKCGVTFHPVCKTEHRKTCNPKGRAKRALASAEEAVREKKLKIAQMRKELQELEDGLVEARKVRYNAKKRLNEMQRR